MQWIAVALGIVIAFVGLLLFVFRKEEGSNRVKVLGQEVEVSKPALVIFIAGCALVGLAVWLSEKRPVQDSKGSGTLNQVSDRLSPFVQIRWTLLEARPSLDERITRGKVALDSAGFTGIETDIDLVYGFNREYTGMILCFSPDQAVFIVSGANWEVANTKAENLKRNFKNTN